MDFWIHVFINLLSGLHSIYHVPYATLSIFYYYYFFYMSLFVIVAFVYVWVCMYIYIYVCVYIFDLYLSVFLRSTVSV